jgi:hypothetical protein
MPLDDQPDFEDAFDASIAEWRNKHRLQEDDAVMLLIELFRIHQQHWDEIRHRELPSFAEFRTDIAKISEGARTFHVQSTALLDTIRKSSVGGASGGVNPNTAILAALACLFAGYLIGRAWP